MRQSMLTTPTPRPAPLTVPILMDGVRYEVTNLSEYERDPYTRKPLPVTGYRVRHSCETLSVGAQFIRSATPEDALSWCISHHLAAHADGAR